MAGLSQWKSTNGAFIPSAARTDHTTGLTAAIATQYNGGQYRGIRFVYDITAFTGTSITFTISGVDPGGANNIYTLLASAAKSATATEDLVIYPGVIAVANRAANTVLPSWWKFVPSGTITSVTYSVSYELLP